MYLCISSVIVLSTTLKPFEMTHSNEFSKAMPYVRRKLNAEFVHELKKLVGKLYHLHVAESIGNSTNYHNADDMGDSVYVFVPYNNDEYRFDFSCVVGSIRALCERYGIGDDYIQVSDGATTFDGADIDGDFVTIFLMKPMGRD